MAHSHHLQGFSFSYLFACFRQIFTDSCDCFASFGVERWVYAGLGIFHFLFTRFCVGRVFLSFNFLIKAGNFQNW